MIVVCFISGSGTNYREIVSRNPSHHYLVFTNRPGCAGEDIARKNNHEIVELSHIPFLKQALEKYGPGKIPRNCPDRLAYEKEAVRLIERKLGQQPDLVCLAGYDLVNTDWMVERYYPRMLNVHPGDNTKGYTGLHWIPAAKAIVAGEEDLRSTLFIVDKGLDTGPVLVQSPPLNIRHAVEELESSDNIGLGDEFRCILEFVKRAEIRKWEDFQEKAPGDLVTSLKKICSSLQDILKTKGDWIIYPFGVHDLIARGRVSIDGRKIYVDGLLMPEYGYRLDIHGFPSA